MIGTSKVSQVIGGLFLWRWENSYPDQYRIRFEDQLSELWTVNCGLLATIDPH